MAIRDPKAWKISSKMEPNFEGGLIHNDFIQGSMFVRATKAQRNSIAKLYRSLEATTTTLCLVMSDSTIYKLINNPAGDTTTDSDWTTAISVASSSGSIVPIGTWDITNLTPVLQDVDATGINGKFYYVTGAPVEIDVTHGGLFLGNTVQVINNDWVISVGTHFVVIRNTTTWESLNRPQTIIDYEAGTVIAHIHSIADITGLSTALAEKYDINDLADMILDFVDVPDSGIGHVAFLRKHFYDKTVTYTRTEVDALLAGISVSDPVFNGNRAIRKIPVSGENVGTSGLGATIEEMFYGFIKPEHTLQSFAVAEVGTSHQATANGSLDPKDAVSFTGNLLVRDELDNVAFQVAPNVPPAITNINDLVNAKTIAAGTAQYYYLEYNYKEIVGGSDINIKGANQYLKGVYPFLYGIAATGLTGANIYTTLTKEVADKSDQEFIFTGANQRVYIAFPETYGEPVSIKDQAGNELIGSLFPASPSVLAVDSSGLTVDWTAVNYNVYESQYDVSLTAESLFVYFEIQEGGINDLDDIPEGTTNKHFDATRRDKLDAILINPADIGDMSEADFISHYAGIIDHAAELAVLGYNDSGAPITQGSYVQITGWNVANSMSTWKTADKDNNDDCNGFVEADILDGAFGIVILKGANRFIDTSAQLPGTRVYLGTSGGVLYSPPVSGSLVQVGTVIQQANPGIISSRDFLNFVTDQYVVEWRPNTTYPQYGVIIYDHPIQGLIMLRAKVGFTSAGTINLSNWDVLGADMKQSVYDADNNGIIDKASSDVIEIHNDTGGVLSKGTLVWISGWDVTSGKSTVIVSNQSTNVLAKGMIVADINDTEDGLIITDGIISGIDTSGLTIADKIYLSDAGAFTGTAPSTGLIQEIGTVIRVDATLGIIETTLNKTVTDGQNLSKDAFSITGGTTVETAIGSNLIVELSQVVTYTLPLISGLTKTDFILYVKNISTGTITLNPSGSDLIEGNASFEMLDGETLTLYITTGQYKIL